MPSKTYPPVFLSAFKSNRTRVNRSFTKLLGLKSSEFAEVPLLSRVHPDDRDELVQVMNAGDGNLSSRISIRKNEWLSFDLELKVKEGEVVVMGRLQGDFDLLRQTAHNRATQDGASLRTTLETMAKIVESKNLGMKCSILLVDWHTECIYMGVGPSLPDEYNEITGCLPIGPFVGSCGTAIYWNTPVIVDNISEDPLWEELRELATMAGVASCWSVPIISTVGEVLGAMALYNDFPCRPERHQLDGLEVAARMVGLAIEHEKLENQVRRGAKMEAIGSLAGGIAHDFNNILTAILGNAELAMEYTSKDSELSELLNNIVKSGLNASELCVQLLGFSGKQGSATESLDCSVLVREICELTRVTFSKKIGISYDLDCTPAFIQGDRSQLGQVVMNLLTNAAESIGPNDGQISITTSTRTFSSEELFAIESGTPLSCGRYICLSITDTGCGMTEKAQRRIFDPFFTTKPTGRGLGLAAVHGIVTGHNGILSVTSVVGQGTEFSLLLPLLAAAPSVPVFDPQPSTTLIKANILIVDDDEMVVEVLKKFLINAGHDVLVASDGEEGISVYREKFDLIDCVLLDLNMPKLDGEEVYRELCLIQEGVKVILCSGFAEPVVIERFKGATLAGILKKPFRMDSLLEKISEAISY